MVFVLIGGNDFINAMYAPDPEAALRAALPRALANYQLVVRTIRAANPDVRLVLATVPDIRLLPEFDKPLRECRLPVRLADACTAAMQRYNAQIRAMSMGDRRIALLDLALVARIANLVSRDYAIVAGKRLDRSHPGNSPDRFFLADGRTPGPSHRPNWPGCLSSESMLDSCPGSSRSATPRSVAFLTLRWRGNPARRLQGLEYVKLSVIRPSPVRRTKRQPYGSWLDGLQSS